jgi:hypothetical protein
MQKLLIPAVVLVVGLVLGFFLGFAQRPACLPSADNRVANAPPVHNTAEPLPELPPATGPEKTTPVPEPQPATAWTFELPDVPTGDGIATGVVHLADGSPCADLALRAIPPLQDGLPISRKRRLRAEERTAYEAAVIRWETESARDASSGPDGSFKFERLAQQTYSVVCLTPGWEVSPQKGPRQSSIAPGEELVLIATRMVSVPLRVLLPDGSEPDRARITARSLDGSYYTFGYWKPDARSIEAPAGGVKFFALGGPDDSLEAEFTTQIPAHGDASEVELQLKRPPGLYLTLEVPTPYYREVSVTLLPAEEARKLTSEPFLARGAKTSRKLSPTSWYYPALPPGDYVAYVGLDRMLVLASENITVAGELTEHSIALAPLDLSEHFTVRTVDSEGKPLAVQRLSCNLADAETGTGDMTAWMEVEPGHYLMRRPGIERDQFGRFVPTEGASIAVQATRGSAKRFGRMPLDDDVVTIVFGESCTLIVEVDNLPEIGRNDMWVAAIPAEASLRREAGMARYSSQQNVVGSKLALEASREFKDLQPGNVVVLVLRDGSSPGSGDEVVLARLETTLQPGTQSVRITMPALHELEVRTSAAQKVRTLWLQGAGLELYEKPNAEGTVKVHALPAGDYWIGDSTAGYMKVTLPLAGPVDFAPLPHNCLRLGSYDKEGMLHRKGLRRGDLVVAINGEYFEGRDKLQPAWEAAQQSASVLLEIERKGQTLQVTLTGEELATALRNQASFTYRRR